VVVFFSFLCGGGNRGDEHASHFKNKRRTIQCMGVNKNKDNLLLLLLAPSQLRFVFFFILRHSDDLTIHHPNWFTLQHIHTPSVACNTETHINETNGCHRMPAKQKEPNAAQLDTCFTRVDLLCLLWLRGVPQH